jgi:amino-acid N-acetyltransferase
MSATIRVAGRRRSERRLRTAHVGETAARRAVGNLEHFLVGEVDGQIVAAAGLEVYGDVVLLRSVVVSPDLRGTGVGGKLSDATMVMAHGLVPVMPTCSLTVQKRSSAAWVRGDRPERVPAGIRNSVEFAVACPASAIVMRRTVARA